MKVMSIFYFPIVKLVDYYDWWFELETNPNPFAVMVMAHLKMLKAGKDVTNLAYWKLEITKTLLERGFSSEITTMYCGLSIYLFSCQMR